MSKFILLLREGQYEGRSPEEMQKTLEKYMSWIQKLRDEGRYHAGEDLKETGRILSAKENRVVDGPFTETKESIGGFFLIEAKDYDEAVRVSKECPHLSYGGVVELREVNPH
jgi:hypothetical protein